jgi:hypothetical protein
VVKAVDHGNVDPVDAELETSVDGPGSTSHRLAAPSRTRVRYLDRSGTEPHPGDLQVGLFPGEVVFNCVRSSRLLQPLPLGLPSNHRAAPLRWSSPPAAVSDCS